MSTTPTDHVERLREEIAQITQPLIDHLAELDETIKQNEREHTELVKARRQLRNVVKGIDPELVEPLLPRRSNGRQRTASIAAPERIARFTAWLQEHKEEINARGGVHASGIVNDKGDVVYEGYSKDIITSQATISGVMRKLHADGVLRLDHMGNGGAKYFKVV